MKENRPIGDESLWTVSAELPRYDSLKENIKTEVLVIGGGMAGILCAYMLERAGVRCVLLEADRICSGVTRNTTAKITSQHGLVYSKLIRGFGMEKAAMYLKANQEAIQSYADLCAKVDCDFEWKDSYVYTLDKPRAVLEELEALEALRFPAGFAQKLPLPFPVAAAVKFPGQAQFHPLKFVAAIAKNLKIFEHTPVREIKGNVAVSDQGSITAEKIIVATHFPFINKHGSYFMKLYQSRSYVTALEGAPGLDGMYVDESEKGMSFRSQDGLLLIGGGGYRTGKQGGSWEELSRFARQYYPNARERNRWVAQDCMTLDGIPYIGNYSKRTQGLYVATGFNKWGMTSSMVGAILLTTLIMGKELSYAEVFSPSRSMLRRQLALNALEAVKSLATFTVPRCPHMGCALKWNRVEHSWDCPCHGSRFDGDGRLLDNPATCGLSTKRKE